MNDEDDRAPRGEAETTTEAVRQGRTFGTMRYVLGISLALAVIALAVAWATMRG